MTSTADLETLARTTAIDLYALLSSSLSPASTTKDITRAYRRAALVSHPDKNPDNPRAAQIFHELSQAHDILSDETLRGVYDVTRAAREAKDAVRREWEDRRRAMVEELEKGEKGGKEDENGKKAEEQGLAADGARRRRELEEKWKREREEREKAERDSEGDRTLKVRWDTSVKHVDEKTLKSKMEAWGVVEKVSKPKRREVPMRSDKNEAKGRSKIVWSAEVIYEDKEEAYKAVRNIPLRNGEEEWKTFWVEWKSGKEPEGLTKNPMLDDDEYAAFEEFEKKTLEQMRKVAKEGKIEAHHVKASN